MGEKKQYHRGRRRHKPTKERETVTRISKHKKKSSPQNKKSGILSTIVLVVALAIFCVSGFQLYKIVSGYKKGQSEYDKLKELALQTDKKDGENGEETFRVNFDELLAINPDTVGWIRFHPEPSQIDYPLVQGKDNSLYLDKTFSASDNTVGAIFVNVYNNADFNDKNTIIYGHRMNDNSMFHDLEKYKDKSFWEANPNFYIYTPDGREITYQVYSAGIVKDTSDTYLTEFATPEDYQNFLNMTKEVADYDTGTELSGGNTIVTLSTCTKASNDDRFVVRGVKTAENYVKEE